MLKMMTIRLAELEVKPALSGQVADELASLRDEVARLKQALAKCLGLILSQLHRW